LNEVYFDWIYMKFLESGRWLFPVPFIVFGLFHLSMSNHYADQMPNYMPGGAFFICVLGFCMIAAGVSLYTGIKARWAALALAVMLLLFIVMLHAPAAIYGGEHTQMALTMLFKDLGLMAGALLYAQYVAKE
jgi:uncharacterized membrane protein YphA (DoxX/SURF4 family)